ncbi:hypothetical protein [Brevibacillus dissolubilis]|uniref:hypothetical protein n=1 Tax=Brevibacillus dissolubilis TaxID=1844116 RepID=UPI001116204B|nr:hypothetical protein [Brevibacillus dissolubilis]
MLKSAPSIWIILWLLISVSFSVWRMMTAWPQPLLPHTDLMNNDVAAMFAFAPFYYTVWYGVLGNILHDVLYRLKASWAYITIPVMVLFFVLGNLLLFQILPYSFDKSLKVAMIGSFFGMFHYFLTLAFFALGRSEVRDTEAVQEG